MREETIKYITADVVSLYQILSIFGSGIHSNYGVDFTKTSTIASLAYRIYRTMFFSGHFIPLTIGNVYKHIKLAYYGGIVDVYRPYGVDLRYYDVNSLYPASMLLDMPIGSPYYHDHDINLEDCFGFFFANISAPVDIHIPVLPVKSDHGTFCPGGSFSGWYFSEELKEAKNQYGYTVTVLRGYSYSRGKIFNKYVNHFYDIKSNKEGSEKAIAKLMLNSLYGKFGMKPILSDVRIVQGEDNIGNILKQVGICDRVYLGDEIEMIVKEIDVSDNDKEFARLNVSVGISAAIAAYSRININRYKFIQGNACFYSDTDSVVLQKDLHDLFVGKAIGLMKREYGVILEGVFISPKVYGLKVADGKDIVKIKGLNSSVKFSELVGLLFLYATLVTSRVE